jgi:hypothetical protein
MLQKVSPCCQNISHVNNLLPFYRNATHLKKHATFLSRCPKPIFINTYINVGTYFLDIFCYVGSTFFETKKYKNKKYIIVIICY